jgi:hypothetical protein
MVYSFNPGTLADRTDDWRSTRADQKEGIVKVIRQGESQLERVCKKSGIFFALGLEIFFQLVKEDIF